MAPIPITYCANVHPGETIDEVLDSLQRWTSRVARLCGGPFPFPVGGWWSRGLVAELRSSEERRARYVARLAELGLGQATVNVFPVGGFHARSVKEQVYRPDWGDEDRVHYTCEAAEVFAQCLPPGARASLSSVPLGFRRPGEPADLRKMARNVVRVATRLRAIEEQTGVSLVLALEPEPCCLLETVAGSVEFLQDRIFGDGSLDVPEGILREHVGLCVDLCHLAVVGEDPVAALAACRSAGVRVGKVQVSCALELRRGDRGLELQELLAFDEPRYLHQASGFASGSRRPFIRSLDLGELRQASADWQACDRIESHFHVPVFWDSDGVLGSTRAEVERTLRAIATDATVPLLEVETYTWGVLPPRYFPEAADPDWIAEGIAREIAFVRSILSEEARRASIGDV